MEERSEAGINLFVRLESAFSMAGIQDSNLITNEIVEAFESSRRNTELLLKMLGDKVVDLEKKLARLRGEFDALDKHFEIHRNASQAVHGEPGRDIPKQQPED